ncbi:MAG: hypothetical protein ACP5HG_11775 [Anaerolineae bacterium]
MFATAEVRWFEEGEIPDHVLDWFAQVHPMSQPEPVRVDHYLRLRDTDGLGIKFREGRIEVKQRYGRASVATLVPNAAGPVERWRKWGFDLAEPAEDREIIQGTEAWVAVRKERQVGHYGVGRDGAVERLPPLPFQVSGCSVELTRVTTPHRPLRGRIWWTLGFEATGKESELVDTLTVVARHVLRSLRGIELSAKTSYGYPRWLQLVVG